MENQLQCLNYELIARFQRVVPAIIFATIPIRMHMKQTNIVAYINEGKAYINALIFIEIVTQSNDSLNNSTTNNNFIMKE